MAQLPATPRTAAGRPPPVVLPHPPRLSNGEIASVLERIADLLAVQGANVFRVRAYRDAARTLVSQSRSVHDMLAGGEDLDRLPGIGPDLAGKIAEIDAQGHSSQLDALRRSLPEGIVCLLEFPGLGPRRVQQLRDALGIETLDDVLRAAEQGRIRTIRGFGAAMERRIRDGVRARLRPSQRFARDEVQRLADALLPPLRALPGVSQAVAAGSLRRGLPTVGDLDLVVASTQPRLVMDRFVTGKEVLSVLLRGSTRASVVLHNGLQVDLRVVDPSCFGAAWLHFTGSKAHNLALRRRAMAQGFKLNEYGLYRARGRGERIAGETETSVYEALGLRWIAPAQREDRGEIEASAVAAAAGADEALAVHGAHGVDAMDDEAMLHGPRHPHHPHGPLGPHDPSVPHERKFHDL